MKNVSDHNCHEERIARKKTTCTPTPKGEERRKEKS